MLTNLPTPCVLPAGGHMVSSCSTSSKGDMQLRCLCVRARWQTSQRGQLCAHAAGPCRSEQHATSQPCTSGGHKRGFRDYLLSHRLQHSHARLLRAACTLELLFEEVDKDVGEEPAGAQPLSLRPRMRMGITKQNNIDVIATTQQQGRPHCLQAKDMMHVMHS